MEQPRSYRDWAEALVAALAEADKIPTEHSLTHVDFGTFADSVGGGHYASLRVSYEVGNTVHNGDGSFAGRAGAADLRRRKILHAWQEATQPTEEQENTK